MKIIKHEHACLEVSVGDERLVIDPGNFLSATDFHDVVAVVVTHEHADHWTPDTLARLLEDNPGIPIYGPPGVAAAASGFEVTVVTAGDQVEVGDIRLRFFGGVHAEIHSSIPRIDNVGVLVDDELYYPGDSYAVPEGVEVGTLAAPVGAPWLKIGEAMDFVLAVAPRRAFYTHDMTLSAAGKAMGAARLGWATEQGGGQFTSLQPGEALDV